MKILIFIFAGLLFFSPVNFIQNADVPIISAYAATGEPEYNENPVQDTGDGDEQQTEVLQQDNNDSQSSESDNSVSEDDGSDYSSAFDNAFDSITDNGNNVDETDTEGGGYNLLDDYQLNDSSENSDKSSSSASDIMSQDLPDTNSEITEEDTDYSVVPQVGGLEEEEEEVEEDESIDLSQMSTVNIAIAVIITAGIIAVLFFLIKRIRRR